MKKLDNQLKLNLERAGMDLRNAVVKNISRGVPFKAGTKTKMPHPQSPGPAFPRADTGRLRQSIDYKVKKKGFFKKASYKLTVGAYTEYAKILELGNPKNGTHYPFLVPTLNKEKESIIKTLSKGLIDDA